MFNVLWPISACKCQFSCSNEIFPDSNIRFPLDNISFPQSIVMIPCYVQILSLSNIILPLSKVILTWSVFCIAIFLFSTVHYSFVKLSLSLSLSLSLILHWDGTVLGLIQFYRERIVLRQIALSCAILMWKLLSLFLVRKLFTLLTFY